MVAQEVRGGRHCSDQEFHVRDSGKGGACRVHRLSIAGVGAGEGELIPGEEMCGQRRRQSRRAQCV